MTKARTNAMTIHYIPPYSRAKDIHIVALLLKLRKSFLSILNIWYGWNHLLKLFPLVRHTCF